MEVEITPLLKLITTLASAVLKIGHHGAAASSCANFLDAVAPQYAVVSCGTPDICEFPKESVLQRLARRFIKLYRTAYCGATASRKLAHDEAAAP